MSTLIDISPPIGSDIAVWPGDVPFSRNMASDMKEGANLTLSSMTTTLHLGAHADGPNHYALDGSGIGERSLELYYGPCEVITVTVPRGDRIRPGDLTSPVSAPRVLFRTGTFPDPNHFNEDFTSLSAELVDHLADAGVCLVGIDTPSIDPCHDRDLESHNAVARHGMAILEGLVLDQVADGPYTLIALPLKLMGADASPVRAALAPTG